MEKIKEP